MRYSALFLTLLLVAPGCQFFKSTSDLTVEERMNMVYSLSYSATVLTLSEIDDDNLTRDVVTGASLIDKALSALISSNDGEVSLGTVTGWISNVSTDRRVIALSSSVLSLLSTYIDYDKIIDSTTGTVGVDNLRIIQAGIRGVLDGAAVVGG